MLGGWSSLQGTVCKGKLFRRQAEQKCFERLLSDQQRLLPPEAEARIVHAPMQAFNSLGRYATHLRARAPICAQPYSTACVQGI